MTVLVGALCKDGVVLGADSAATSSDGTRPLIEHPAVKVHVVDGSSGPSIVAGTGSVGFDQRFRNILRTKARAGVLGSDRYSATKSVSRAFIDDMAGTLSPKGQYGALLAFRAQDGYQLCEFSLSEFQPEFRESPNWFATMGSGASLAEPFLAFVREVFWPNETPDLAGGVFATVWALEHVIKYNPGGVNAPMRVAVLSSSGNGPPTARILTDSELDEHRQMIESTKRGMREIRLPTTTIVGISELKLPTAPAEMPPAI